jgi:hypothetical protein
VILRCTARAVGLLAGPRADVPHPPESEDDWYANLLWIERRKCVLLMHAGTLFPVFVADVRAAAWRPPGPAVVTAIESALAREQLAAGTFGVLDPAAVVLAATASRRVLGYLNETAHACRHGVELAGGLDHVDVDELNRRLCRLLHNRDGYLTALDRIAQRVAAR